MIFTFGFSFLAGSFMLAYLLAEYLATPRTRCTRCKLYSPKNLWRDGRCPHCFRREVR